MIPNSHKEVPVITSEQVCFFTFKTNKKPNKNTLSYNTFAYLESPELN